jgi:hypothetical protein
VIFPSAFATHEQAFHETHKVDGFCDLHRDKEDLIWGVAATTGTMSTPHIDNAGLATCISVMAGSKWWVVMRKRQDMNSGDRQGDLSSIHFFPLNWDTNSTGKEFLEAEGLHLKQGDVL